LAGRPRQKYRQEGGSDKDTQPDFADINLLPTKNGLAFGVHLRFNSPNASTDNCWQAGAVRLSAAQTKTRLLHITPISSPSLYSSLRITNAVLSFKVGTGQDGNVTCIRAIGGHPLIIGVAIESIKTWEFRPTTAHGQRQAIVGTLIITVSGTEHGLKATVLNAEPQKAR